MNKPDYISDPDWKILNNMYPNSMDDILNILETGYPVQYLIGNVDFLNTKINVSNKALIPRFETEGLVDKTIKIIKKIFNKPIQIIDLGTGTGCIAIALAKNTNSKVYAIDISNEAIKIAKENAKLNNVDVVFLNKGISDNLVNNYDVIISNPPYIPMNGYVDENVLKYEPHIALFAANNGLYFYKEILNKHLKKLNKPGLIAFEIGYNQVDDLKKILGKYPQLNYIFENDLSGLPRYLFIFNE